MSKTLSDQDVINLTQAISKVWALIGPRKTGKRISDQDMKKMQKAISDQDVKNIKKAKGGKIKKRASGGRVKKRK